MKKRREPGRILRLSWPAAQYAGALLVSLNLQHLPRKAWLLPGIFGSRAFLMLWTLILLILAWRGDLARSRGAEEDQKRFEGVSHELSFLALAVPGLFLLDLCAAAHLYLSWYHSGMPPVSFGFSVPVVLMAAGCVFWIYGRVLPRLPFDSIWGLRTPSTRGSREAWDGTHRKAGYLFLLLGAALLLAGTVCII